MQTDLEVFAVAGQVCIINSYIYRKSELKIMNEGQTLAHYTIIRHLAKAVRVSSILRMHAEWERKAS